MLLRPNTIHIHFNIVRLAVATRPLFLNLSHQSDFQTPNRSLTAHSNDHHIIWNPKLKHTHSSLRTAHHSLNHHLHNAYTFIAINTHTDFESSQSKISSQIGTTSHNACPQSLDLGTHTQTHTPSSTTELLLIRTLLPVTIPLKLCRLSILRHNPVTSSYHQNKLNLQLSSHTPCAATDTTTSPSTPSSTTELLLIRTLLPVTIPLKLCRLSIPRHNHVILHIIKTNSANSTSSSRHTPSITYRRLVAYSQTQTSNP
jgi:hypothetical protein